MIEKAVSLHCTKGTSDKVYHLQIVRIENDKFIVQTQNGRRGGKLKYHTKTDSPVRWWEANRIFDDKVSEQIRKGYKEIPVPEDLLFLISLST